MHSPSAFCGWNDAQANTISVWIPNHFLIYQWHWDKFMFSRHYRRNGYNWSPLWSNIFYFVYLKMSWGGCGDFELTKGPSYKIRSETLALTDLSPSSRTSNSSMGLASNPCVAAHPHPIYSCFFCLSAYGTCLNYVFQNLTTVSFILLFTFLMFFPCELSKLEIGMTFFSVLLIPFSVLEIYSLSSHWVH